MATSIRRIYVLMGALLIGFAAIQPSPRAIAQPKQPLLMIMAATSGITNIEIAQVRSAYDGATTEVKGLRLVPLNLPVGDPARIVIDKVILGLSLERVGAYWVDQRIRHNRQPPRTIPSPELMLRVVASMRGAIGYVKMSSARVPAGLRVLSVQGEKPIEPRYLFAGH